MKMKTYSETDIGRRRETNQDEVLCEKLDAADGYLLAVADGMGGGGHPAGEVASRTAITELREFMKRALDDEASEGVRSILGGIGEIVTPGSEDEEDLDSLLKDAFEKANDEMRALVEDNPEYEGMGTTLVAAVVRDGNITIGNVGDSRAYLVGDDGIEQVTKDQSLVQELVEQGSITEEEADEHRYRSMITQALGTEEEIEPDFYSEELGDDALLLCSDGLTEEVKDEKIQEVLDEEPSIQEAGDRLIELANENGGSDNISVVLAQAEDA